MTAASPAMQSAFAEIDRANECAAAQMRDRDIAYLRESRFAFFDKASAVLSIGYSDARELTDEQIRAHCCRVVESEKRRRMTWRGGDDWRWHWASVLIAVIDERVEQ